ncbi:WD40 repeat-like protein [Auricularia subglabra TFB-10046 SS5]|nr:WD40 repeat-like protein [Auricularia subglabra TFB-10046 SS5]
MGAYTIWRSLDGHTHIINFVAFSSSGELLATGDDGGNVFIWTLSTGDRFQSLPPHESEAVSCCWGDDKELFVGYGNGEVHFFEHSRLSNKFERSSSVSANQHGRHVASLAIHGNLLACCSSNGVHCWRIERPVLRPVFNMFVDVREVRAVHFLDRHTILATAIHEGQCILLDVLSPSKPLWRRKLRHRIGESAVSPDGTLLAITNLAAAVQVYEIVPTGLRLLHEFSSPMNTANNFPLQTCFAEIQGCVAAGSDNGEVRLWRLSSGAQLSLLHDVRKTYHSGGNGRKKLVQTVTAYSSADHYYLASACANGKQHMIRIWRRSCKTSASGIPVLRIATAVLVIFLIFAPPKCTLAATKWNAIATDAQTWWNARVASTATA